MPSHMLRLIKKIIEFYCELLIKEVNFKMEKIKYKFNAREYFELIVIKECTKERKITMQELIKYKVKI